MMIMFLELSLESIKSNWAAVQTGWNLLTPQQRLVSSLAIGILGALAWIGIIYKLHKFVIWQDDKDQILIPSFKRLEHKETRPPTDAWRELEAELLE